MCYTSAMHFLTTEFILPDKAEEMRTCYPVIDEPIDEDFTITPTTVITPALFIENQPNVRFLPTDLHRGIAELVVIRVWNCSVTSVNEIHFKGLSNLRTLSLFHNKIEKIASDAFFDLVNLEYLDLDDNRIHFVGKKTFASLKALKKLNLDINEIYFIHPEAFSALANVQIINLSRNVMVSIDENIFRGMTSLKHIFMTNNQLEKIPKDLFKINLKLAHVRLECNKIGFIDENVFDHLPDLANVNLKGNKCIKGDYYTHGTFDKLYEICNNETETQNMNVQDSHLKKTRELKTKTEAMDLVNKALQNNVDKVLGQIEVANQRLNLMGMLLTANYEALNRKVDAVNETLQNAAPEFEG